MNKLVTEVYRLYWSKKRADYVHPATGLSRSALMKMAKERFNKCEVEYTGEGRNICWLKIYVQVGG
jgi:hypothetical protein